MLNAKSKRSLVQEIANNAYSKGSVLKEKNRL